MVKMMRPPQRYQLAGEPDAWGGPTNDRYGVVDAYRPLDGGRRQRRQAELADRTIPRAIAPYQSSTQTSHQQSAIARDVGADDFRVLARTIERRRQWSGALEPVAPSRPAPAARPAMQALTQRWLAEDNAPARSERPRDVASRPIQPQHSARPVPLREPAKGSRADALEIARLEGVLDDVLQRLQALEQANRTPQERPVPSSTVQESRSRRTVPPREQSSDRPTSRDSRASAARADDDPGARPRRLFR